MDWVFVLVVVGVLVMGVAIGVLIGINIRLDRDSGPAPKRVHFMHGDGKTPPKIDSDSAWF